ncbi:YdcH family protein [Acuticoccus sediminis]
MLKEQHRDLDAAVEALEYAGSTDLLQIKRLKKRKLQLKDEIRLLSDRILPDIIA